MNFLTKQIKYAVSGKRKRFIDHKYDLDLTYILPNVIAMGFPGEGVEGMYRNNLDEVAAFLKEKHKGHFMIWNLSEKLYDYSKVDDQVLCYGFPDHHNPPLDLLFAIIKSLHSWLKADSKNVSVTHCLAGKGRTGTVIACYLLYIGHVDDPRAALDLFERERQEGVTSPSQMRYVQYFHHVLKNQSSTPVPKSLVLKKIFVHHGNSLQHPIQIQLFQLVSEGPNKVAKKLTYMTQNDKDLTSLDDTGIFSYSTNVPLQGDVLMICRNKGLIRDEKLFRAAFHTGFVEMGMLRFTKQDMDYAVTNKKIPASFIIDLIFDEQLQQLRIVHDNGLKMLYSTRSEQQQQQQQSDGKQAEENFSKSHIIPVIDSQNQTPEIVRIMPHIDGDTKEEMRRDENNGKDKAEDVLPKELLVDSKSSNLQREELNQQSDSDEELEL